MPHPHSALQIYQFLSTLHQSCPNKETFDSILLSLQTPRFTPVTTITERWTPTFQTYMPQLLGDFQQLMASAARSPEYDALVIKVSEHYPLIYRVSCFLENDLELELFVRCLCLDSATPVNKEEVKQTLMQFFRELPQDAREYVQEIVMEDHHGYLSREDCMADDNNMQPVDGFLDLDKVYQIVNDPGVFDQLMAIIQTNTARGVIWSQTIQEIYELVAAMGIWEQLAPLLQQVQVRADTNQYESYEDYVQKNFLDNGGQQYLDDEINRAQVEHMLGNLTM
ncbi:hypothetical protein V8B55DRAFT_1447083 [Mucor lusitanicus]|uniref:Uncharacterized protein n=2 Tax=Mucor circinelloides f. lusitanicus TaxID=29924 RepID=A0A162Y707_MUCCL|nr:hypothetical protein FB192DRAFT_1071664 [Mucor lusitanicus]OAC97696.1 hypothetical protein MUCCIDRAFT_116183 [Mucor lusitanicus CBS 277.49]